MNIKQPVFSKVVRVWIAFSARKIGSIPANSQITNLWDYKRSSSKFTDWLANNNLKRKDIVLRSGFIGQVSNMEIYAPSRL